MSVRAVWLPNSKLVLAHMIGFLGPSNHILVPASALNSKFLYKRIDIRTPRTKVEHGIPTKQVQGACLIRFTVSYYLLFNTCLAGGNELWNKVKDTRLTAQTCSISSSSAMFACAAGAQSLPSPSSVPLSVCRVREFPLRPPSNYSDQNWTTTNKNETWIQGGH